MFVRSGNSLRVLTLACIASVSVSAPSLAQGFDPSNAQAVGAATGNAAATTGDVAAAGAGAGIILTGTAVALGALKRSTSSPGDEEEKRRKHAELMRSVRSGRLQSQKASPQVRRG